MAISANIFEKCLPAIGTNINECGGLTLCDVSTATPALLETIFKDGSSFRDMGALLATQFEIKACGAKVNGLFDFLMANKKMMTNRVIKVPLGPGNSEIMPFIMAGQKSVINSEYWSVPNLFNTAGTYTIQIRSRTSIPLDTSWFAVGSNVYVFSKSTAGSALRGSFKITQSEPSSFGGNSTIKLTATAENTTLGSAAKSAFSGFSSGSPLSTAFLVIGSPNVQDVESWCNNRPGLNPAKNVAFWWEVDRWTMCTDEYYEAAYKRLKEGNPYFARFGDIDATQRNKQYGERFQREWLNKFFWNKPISSNQTLANYRSLEQVNSFVSPGGAAYGGLYLPGEGRCVGRKANAIGVYEQLSECGSVKDLQGQRLNLVELFQQDIYDVWRARGDQGIPNDVIEIYTDNFTRSQIQRSMIQYYNVLSAGLARFNIDTKQVMMGNMGQLGFNYDEYKLDYPMVTIRVVTHNFFDDFAAAARAESVDSTGRFLWILDWTSIYPGIITSNRKVHRTGDIEKLAAVDYNYACVMENPTQEVSLNSLTWAAIVECTSTSRIVENFASEKLPSYSGVTGSTPYDLYDIT